MTAISFDPFLPADIPEEFNIAAYFVDAPAARHPHKTAIVGEPRVVSYAELSELTNRAGNALLGLGVARGDRVLIVLPDSAEFIASFFGAAKIGAVAVPVNPFARSADYIQYIEDSEPSAAIVH
jgi:benzoate-CoA ligase